MDYCQKLMYLFETDASVDEIIDCACMMGPHEACSTRIELLVLYFLEDKEDELVWRVLHGSEDIAYGAAYFLIYFDTGSYIMKEIIYATLLGVITIPLAIIVFLFRSMFSSK